MKQTKIQVPLTNEQSMKIKKVAEKEGLKQGTFLRRLALIYANQNLEKEQLNGRMNENGNSNNNDSGL